MTTRKRTSTTNFSYLMETVALQLLGQPNKTLSTKSELRYGNKGSLAVDLRKGTFYDHENNEGGGVLDLIKRQTNCIDPIAWLHHEKLLSTAEVIPLRPRQQIEKPDTTPFARHIWHESQPAVGTLVETYLKSRAITIPPPASLKFHPSLEYRRSTTFWPCMVAVVSNAQGFLGIHRTFLARDGNGKAPIDEPKLALGKIQGGAVRLGPVTEKIYIAEGIETALSVMQVKGGSVWATIGTSGMLSLELPSEIREVTICADGDPEGERAAHEAGWRFKYQGRTVNIARPPRGKDFNDVLREEVAS